MINEIRFERYRGFERFRADLSGSAYLVGPNSAGKSTIIEALALAEQCMKVARRKAPNISARAGSRSIRAFAMASQLNDTEDPVRYDFASSETRVDLIWSSGAKLHLVWPQEDPDEPTGAFFWLEYPNGMQPRLKQIDELYPAMAIVPVITPLDHLEDLKNESYVTRSVNTRLASRHFRNHIRLLTRHGEFEQFQEFIAPWLPEIQLENITFDPSAARLAFFYGESRSRVPKEIAWAGDGMQIWIQLLWHIYRNQGARTVVLDEPEVYLHPDLQRRLVRLLEDLNTQVILASHSSEVISEAPQGHVVWIDRTSTHSKRIQNPRAMESMADNLGSNYNLVLVRSLRSRLVLVVDGDDVPFIRRIARVVGANRIATEYGVNIVPLRTFGDWPSSAPLSWMRREILTEVPHLGLLLSSGARPAEFNERLRGELEREDIDVEMWRWRELINPLLAPRVLARASGSDEFAMHEHLDVAFRNARAEASSARLKAATPSPLNEASHSRIQGMFDLRWSQAGQVELVSGAAVIKELNESWLEPDGYRHLTHKSIASAATIADLPLDMVESILKLEDLAAT